MNKNLNRRNSQKKEITISTINNIIHKISEEYISKNTDIINNKQLTKISESIDNLYLKSKGKIYIDIKLQKFLQLLQKNKQYKTIKMNKINDSEKEYLINNAITSISIILLKDYINKQRHNYVQSYLKSLLFFIYNNILKIDNFIFIIDVLLKTIIYFLNKNNFQIFQFRNEPLLFINDIIESIANNNIDIRNNNKFIEKLINMFNNNFLYSKSHNIFIEKKEIFLKLLENREIDQNYFNNSENNPLNKLNFFLVDIFKNHISKKFFYEIFKRSAIDLPYYLNILQFIKMLFKSENELKVNKDFKIRNGINFFGNTLDYKNLNFNTKDFSLIFSFKIDKIEGKKDTDIILFNLTKLGKSSIIRILINKENNLLIKFNNESECNTNIIIEKEKSYLVCIIYNNKNNNLTIYINNEKTSSTDIVGQNVFLTKSCYRYIYKKINRPHFLDNMIIQLGKENFYGVLGEVVLINKDLEEESVKLLFNSKEYYGNLIYGKNFDNNLIKKKIKFSQNCIKSINHFKTLNYECLLTITPNSFFSNNKESKICEYKITNSIYDFFNEKGIEYLIFMLYNINSQIKENKLFNLYIYKTIDFIYDIYNYYQEIKNKILEDESGNYDSYYEINEEDLIKQIDIFFLSFLSILKNKNKNKNNNSDNDDDNYSIILSGEIRKSLINCLSLKIEKAKLYKNIILSLLLDFELFEQKKYVNELNQFFSSKLFDISMINNDIIYNLFLFDFIFELKNTKHKNYCNIIGNFFNNNIFCKKLVKYICKINSEAKIYHYLKIIYYNIDLFKIEDEEKFHFFRFIEMRFETLQKEHCKYCSYIIILCYLIKNKLWNDNVFIYNTFGYMTSPSFLFIRAIFIQNFNLDNCQKIKFIKTKNKNLYNMDYFDSIKKSPVELIDVNSFIIKLKELIQYFVFLFNYKRNKDLDIVLENIFPFILEFLEKIRKKDILNNNNKKAIDFIKILFSSQEVTDFFILYLKYNQEKALKSINNYIKSSIITILNPFYFHLLLPQTELGNKNIAQNIKIEIMKNIILEIINRKKTNNLYYILILIYKNIYEEDIKISKDFPSVFVNFALFISVNQIFLEKKPLDLNFFNNSEKKEYIDDIKESKKNNVKFISEIIIDIIFKFFFEENFNIIHLIDNILIKEKSTSIFYGGDDENIKNYKKKSIYEKTKMPFFKSEFTNFLFCLYFLIILFNKLKKYQNFDEKKKNVIHRIIEMLFNDLIKIYKENHKITSRLKKVENYGPNFQIYNKMLDICNKKYKESTFTSKYLYDKYSYYISEKNNELDNDKKIGIEQNNTNIDDKINVKKYKIIRSKSFENLIPNHLKKKYLDNKGNERTYTYFNLEEQNNILNQSMLIKLPLDLNDDNKIICRNQNVEENDSEGENYLKNELSKINLIDFYYQKIINICSPNSIKALFNPKSYFLWNNFTIFFKDLIFRNKKFKKISKAFEMHTRRIKVIFSSEKDKNFKLNYPTKIKNYIIDDYYRPLLKPYLNFFNQKYITKSHSYINKNILINDQFKEDKFYSIKFQRIIPKINNKTKKQKINCEIVKNKGNVFGYMIFNKDYIMFINSSEDDFRKSDDLNKRMEYIYSIKEDSIKDENKYIIIFYKDIKEIIKRRICFNYIGYEIFMKDNHSYLFNFFNYDNIKIVNTNLQNIKNNNKDNLKLSKNIIESRRKKSEKCLNIYAINTLQNFNNIFPSNNNDINFKVIDDPTSTFEKMQYKSKYKRGEITNFNYLLLLNKYSSRTFNDYNQYLIFPLLFMDVSRKKKRDLSKAICLNKDDDTEIKFKIINNNQIDGYHFNQHYSTGGYILFYLLRLMPFTNCLIEFQSGKFDLPARLFNSMKNFLYYFTLTQDNRELCPEFYFNYEFILNLNYNDFGIMEMDNQNYHLNNLDCGNNEIFVQFIINLRNILDKSDISPWIDNIFGSKQFSNSDEEPNSYPQCSYEQFSELEKIKNGTQKIEDKIESMQRKIDILKFGITPAKIFSRPHPKATQHINEFEEELNYFDRKKQKIIDKINNYIEKKFKEKEDFYLINNNNNNINEIELIFKFNTKIDIFKLKIKEMIEDEDSFIINGQIDMEPYNNLFCKILPGIICLVRNKDKTIKIISKKNVIIEYQWTCIVTAIEPFIQKKVTDYNKTPKKVLIGDENGYLHLMEIEYDFIQNDKSYEIKSVKIIKSVKAHSSLITGIIYNERLNIIISWSDEGVISINNDYSFNFLNIIDLGTNIKINEIFISKNDLLFISCFNVEDELYKLFCFTLNGIQVSQCENSKKIINCILDEKICIIYEDGNILSHNFYDLYELNGDTFSEYIASYEETNIKKIIIKHCIYYPSLQSMLIIYSNNKVRLQKLPKNFI